MWGRAPRSAAGENFLGSRWGRNSQNLRSREGFCKKLKGWRGVWGAALAKFLILMLFYVFLHHFLSIFLIFNNFLSFFSYVFLSFLSVLGLYSHARVGQLPPLPPQGGAVTCQGGAAAPSAPLPSYALGNCKLNSKFIIATAPQPFNRLSRNFLSM